MAAERSFLVPYPLGIADEQEHVFAVSGTLAAFGQSAREAIDQAATFGDADIADLFTEISRGHRPSIMVRRIPHRPQEMITAHGEAPELNERIATALNESSAEAK